MGPILLGFTKLEFVLEFADDELELEFGVGLLVLLLSMDLCEVGEVVGDVDDDCTGGGDDGWSGFHVQQEHKGQYSRSMVVG